MKNISGPWKILRPLSSAQYYVPEVNVNPTFLLVLFFLGGVLGLTAFAAALIYTLHNKDILQDSRELTLGHFGYCYILAWTCVPLLLVSGLMYIHLRKKEWPTKKKKKETVVVLRINKNYNNGRYSVFVLQSSYWCLCFSRSHIREHLHVGQ